MRFYKKSINYDGYGIQKDHIRKIFNAFKRGAKLTYCPFCPIYNRLNCDSGSAIVKHPSGSIRVGCTLIPKEDVQRIRKWAFAK